MLALSNRVNSLVKQAAGKTDKIDAKYDKPKEKKVVDPEQMTKQEIMDCMGIIDPIIKPEVSSVLSSVSYRRKTKTEAGDEVVKRLDDQIEKLAYKRMKLLENQSKGPQQEEEDEIQAYDEDGEPIYSEDAEFKRAADEKNVEKMEQFLAKRKQKLQELEQMYKEKKGIEELKKSGLMDELRAVKSSNVDMSKLMRSSFGDKRKEAQARNPIVQLNNEINKSLGDTQQKDSERRSLLARSQALTYVDPKKADFEQRVKKYASEKKLQKDADKYLTTLERPNFDKYRSPDSFENFQEHRKSQLAHSSSPVSHKPINLKEKEQIAKMKKSKNQTQLLVEEAKAQGLKNEIFILKIIFNAIDVAKEGIIAKKDLVDYVMSNQDIVTVYNITKKFDDQVEVLRTQFEDHVTFDEFLKLMLKDQLNVHSYKLEVPEKEKQPQKEPPPKLDTFKNDDASVMNVCKDVFEFLDEHDDAIVPTIEYIEQLLNDDRIKAVIHKPMLVVPFAEKKIRLIDIFDYIKADYHRGFSDGINRMEFISWNQFQRYFSEEMLPQYQNISYKVEEKPDEYYLREEQLEIVHDIFDSLEHFYGDHVDKIQFVRELKQDPQVASFLEKPFIKGDSLSLSKILDKFLEQKQKDYVSWGDFLEQITMAPQPEEEAGTEGAAPVRNRGAGPIDEGIKEEAHEDDEGAEVDFQKPKRPQTENIVQRFEDEDVEKEYQDLLRNFEHYEKKKAAAKDGKGLTIPAGPKFLQREKKENIRQKKVQEWIAQKEKEMEDNLNVRFKANNIPMSTKVPMYDTIKKSHDERRAQVKEQSKAITMQNQKPFSFYERDMNKVKPEREEPQPVKFKANPIPSSTKIEVMKQKEEEDKKAREERVKKRAEELQKSAWNPLDMERHNKPKKNAYVEPTPDFKPKINKIIPDFKGKQKEFMDSLASKKQDRPKTEAKPFSFVSKDEQRALDLKKQQEELEAAKEKKRREKFMRKQSLKRKSTATFDDRSKPQTRQNLDDAHKDDGEPIKENNDEYGETGETGDNENKGQDEYGDNKNDDEYGDNEQKDEENKGEDEYGDDFENNEEKQEGEDGLFQVDDNYGGGDQGINPGAQQNEEEKPQSTQKLKEPENTQSLANTNEKKGLENTNEQKKEKLFLTKKLQSEVERKRKYNEDKQREIDQKKQALEKKKQHEKDFKPKVCEAFKKINKPDEKELERTRKVQEHHEHVKQQQKDYDSRIKEMTKKIESGPMLFESKHYGSKVLRKYRNAISELQQQDQQQSEDNN